MFYQDLANPRALPAYRKLLEESPAAALAASLWDMPDFWFMYEQVFRKEGGETRRTPWHEDSSYLPGDDPAATTVFDRLPERLAPGDPFRDPGFPKLRP